MNENPTPETDQTVPAPAADNIRKHIRARRSPEISALAQLGAEFLDRYKKRNVMTYEEFQKYTALFVKDQLEALSIDERRALDYEWGQRVDIQHAVTVIDPREIDETNGMLWEIDHKKHKIVYTLLPRIRKLEAVNKLGGNMQRLAAECIANAQGSSNPFDKKGAYYSDILGKIVALANKDTIQQQDIDRTKLMEDANSRIGVKSDKMDLSPTDETATVQNQMPAEDANPKGIDAEWE